jgi:hypothetical protein
LRVSYGAFSRRNSGTGSDEHVEMGTIAEVTRARTTSCFCIVRRFRATERGVEEVCAGEEKSLYAQTAVCEMVQQT